MFLDFAVLGHQTHFKARVRAKFRRQLHDGQRVMVYGDDVPAMPAKIVRVLASDAEVEIQLVDS